MATPAAAQLARIERLAVPAGPHAELRAILGVSAARPATTCGQHGPWRAELRRPGGIEGARAPRLRIGGARGSRPFRLVPSSTAELEL